MALRLFLPTVSTEHLIPGIDNIRFDVSLSPKFVEFCQGLVMQLLVKHSEEYRQPTDHASMDKVLIEKSMLK